MIPGPAWVADAVASVFVVVALYCATSLVLRGRPFTRTSAAEANHVLMALAMAVMALPAGASLLPPGVGTVVFGAAAAGWLLVAVVDRARGRALGAPVGVSCAAHPVHLLLLDGAMVAMDVAMRPAAAPSGPAAMPGMAGMHGMAGHGGHVPAHALAPALVVVAVGLTVYLAAHALVGGLAVGAMRTAPAGPGGGLLRRATTSPRAQTGCQVIMSLGTAGMLLLLVL